MTNLPLVTPQQLAGGHIGQGAVIRADSFEAAGSFSIGEGVVIEAERVVLGEGATVGAGVKIRAIRGTTALFQMGDYTLIDELCNVMVPEFRCGDYTRIFRLGLISGYEPVTIGHNGWFGEGTVLNSARRLSLGNNVRVGGSQIWTHVASGELLLGSRFYNEAPVTIEDDVWLVGRGHIISPGLTLARGSVIMAGSTIAKSTEPWHTYSGAPAKDITDKLPAWTPLSEAEKWDMLRGFVAEFLEANPDLRGRVACAETDEDLAQHLAESRPMLIFARMVNDWQAAAEGSHTVLDLASKTYIKRRSAAEVRWHGFAVGFRARFVPRPE